jgi:hypothetical protein
MTFLDILQDCYRRCGFASSPAADVVTRFKAYVNETHRAILSDSDLSGLRKGTATFASVASQTTYGLTPASITIRAISERTNYRKLEPMTIEDLRRVDPGLTASGDPTHYIPLGRVAVAIQPSDASELFVKSSSASDTTQTLYLEGFTDGGYVRSASVTLTGTTAVSLAAAITSWVAVTDLYLSASAAGVVTLHEDSGAGAELARIGIGQLRTRYQGIQLWPTPSQAITYYVDGDYEIEDLVNNTDEPLLPRDFHDILALGARVKEYEKTDDLKRYQIAQREYFMRKNALRYWVIQQQMGQPIGRSNLGYSVLGPWYPSGS